jgi:Zn-dependent peptidase ImmA (M78 family)
MSLRDQLLHAAKRASEVLEETAAKRRISESGYTRIDPIAIAEGDEVSVMVRPLDKLLGAFLNPDGSPGILVNSQRPIGMVHLTCAHELGHYFLGHDTRTDEDLDYGGAASPDEQAANEFAYTLLMPRWLVVNVMKRKGWGLPDLQHAEVIYQLSLRLGVSYTAMVWALQRIKFLKPDIASQLSRSTPKSLKKAASLVGELPSHGGDVWVLDPRDKDSVIEPRATDQFVVQLPSHIGAGYIWTIDEAVEAGFSIKPFVVDASLIDKPEAPVVAGNGESMRYLLEPSDAAVHSDEMLTLEFSERQPWASGNLKGHFGLRTQYESISDGLSRGSRQRLLDEAAQR